VNGQLQFRITPKFLSHRRKFFGANGTIGIHKFAPHESADGTRHNPGSTLKVGNGPREVAKLLPGDPQHQQTRTFKWSGPRDLLKFRSRPVCQTKVQVAVGSE
jgi:hypothetical protein